MVMLNSELAPHGADLLPAELRPLYPFQSQFLDLPAGSLHYLDEGPRDAPVLLLLHGNPTWSFYYRHLVLALRDQYRVIVPDHLGCGLSDKPQNYPYNWLNHRENLAALLAHLQIERMNLIAHDWGGLIGLSYAAENPEKIDRITLFNTAGFAIPVPRRIRYLRFNLIGWLFIRWFNGFINGGFLFATQKRQRFTQLIKRGYRLPYDTLAHRAAILHFIHDIPLEADHPQRPMLASLERYLPTIRCPMQIIWGMQDFCFTPQVLKTWRERCPHAEVVEIADAGHWVVEDAHEQIIPLLLQFLSKANGKNLNY